MSVKVTISFTEAEVTALMKADRDGGWKPNPSQKLQMADMKIRHAIILARKDVGEQA